MESSENPPWPPFFKGGNGPGKTAWFNAIALNFETVRDAQDV